MFFSFIILVIFALPDIYSQESWSSVLQSSAYQTADKQLIERVISKSVERKIDPELLAPRLEEGVAKKVTAARLITALERDIAFLEKARELFLRIEDGYILLEEHAAWQRAANLLLWGSADVEILRFAEACIERPKAFQPATFLFVLLFEWGLDRSTAVEVASAAAQSEIEVKLLPEIIDIFVRGRRMLIPPSRMSNRIIDALGRIRTLDQLEERTLYE